LQIGLKDKRKLKGVPYLETTFRQALAVLQGASLLVTTDGALHHAAAALGVPAVVIWGGFTSPKNLGYDSHTNLWTGAHPCGIWKYECPHCRKALNAITPQQVIDAIGETLERSERHLVA
jgi:ADP-heptose:LPS heptosyltransferase